ncbi:hypothetical protein GCM10010213_03630 [Microbacterium maritypicum]|nr:hypothetical protein MLI01_03620 [Microbacterium liquefaciens]GGV49905.1 hypothetical protein GCM10010213_03630 [Microbacterium liquefaciens]
MHNECGRPDRSAAHLQKGKHMGIEDAVNKGKDLYEQNKDKIAEAVKSEQAEDISDKVLDGVADFAKKIAPGAADKIDEIRDGADKAVGNE